MDIANSHSIHLYFGMEQHVGGCLHSVAHSLSNNFVSFHCFCFNIAEEQYDEMCL